MKELAIGLGREGYPTIALPGSKPEQVELFVGRKMPGTYDQNYLNSRTLGGDSILFFDKYVKNKPAPNAK